MSRRESQDAPEHKLAAWAARAGTLNPIIEKAHQDGILSQAKLERLASHEGIPLASTTEPVILILPDRPIRNVKYRAPEQPPQAGPLFEAAEHAWIGDTTKLRFSASDPGTPAYQLNLALPNGLELTFGQILALGGDFFGIPDKPISDGASEDDRIARFIAAFDSLVQAKDAPHEAKEILSVMQEEIHAVNEALKRGEPASSAYKELGDSLSIKWNRITGGGCSYSGLFPMGRYLKLADVNWDHFGQHAVLAYQAGHAAALARALLARTAPADKQRHILSHAYAMDAFACHYLSDLFSAGHIRTPRKQLYDTIASGAGPHMVSSLLARSMHDEDSRWGLNVINKNRSAWRAYGDKRYFDTVALASVPQIDQAVQASVNEVFDAFNKGTVQPPSKYVALDFIPNLAAAQNDSSAHAAGNISPLFVWNGSTTIRRKNGNDLNDYRWTDDWWGWSTLVMLKISNPNPPTGYLDPPTGAPMVSPKGWQSDHSVPPNWVDGAQVRYAVSFVNKLYESDIGPWSHFASVGQNQAQPTLIGVPRSDLPDTVARRIYRQFHKTPYSYVGQIGDNTSTEFVDTMP